MTDVQPDRRPSQGHLSWEPTEVFSSSSVLARYLAWLEISRGEVIKDYHELLRWSTTSVEDFWESVWQFFGVRSHQPYTAVRGEEGMPGTQWFPGATLNYAEHALSHDLETPAVIGLSEAGDPVELSWEDLRGQVGAVAAWLSDHGVVRGDRVVGYLPNIPATVVGFLACASIGAIWSSCAQEYSAHGAADRFGQLDPVVLIAADGYHYAGKEHARGEQVKELLQLLPTVRATLLVNNIGHASGEPGMEYFEDVIDVPSPPSYASLPFDHPLWVLYSSGTTGRPKGIVQGHGGITLEQLKLIGFHLNVQPGSRFLWFTTTSWMMWNVQVSGLLLGATVVLYDGSPTWPDQSALWRLAAETRLDFLGASAAYLLACQKAGLRPGTDFDLGALSALGSTGSPLPASCYDWVYESLPQVWLNAISGGTDICSAFAGGVPTLPIHAGEMQSPLLGVAMEAWDPDGNALVGNVGELVVTRPMPSMPLYFWDDADGSRYHDAYFSTYPGVWRHGDWVTITTDGGVIIHGRSDATMNRFGVRMGSAEIYEVVEQLDDVQDALVVGIEQDDGGYWMPLFVTTREGRSGSPDLADLIRTVIRTSVSPRHVPDEVIFVSVLPRTLSGKRLEVPVKRILQGVNIDEAANANSVDRPEALRWFADFAAHRKSVADGGPRPGS